METNTQDVTVNEITQEQKKGKCFVMMPFDKWHESYYETIYKRAIEESGFEAIKADDFYKPSEIMADIWTSIQSSDVLIADLTGKNPNVFYELGLAHAAAKPVILISSNTEEIPFDLRAIRHFFYDKNNPNWGKDLCDSIKRALENSRSLQSIPQLFRVNGGVNTLFSTSLSLAINDCFQGIDKIDTLRISAHSTSAIYNLISSHLDRIMVDKCYIRLRYLSDEENKKEQEIINNNVKYWKILQERNRIKELHIWGYSQKPTEYQIIINNDIIIAGIYYDDNSPSGIGYQNTIYTGGDGKNKNLINTFIKRFDSSISDNKKDKLHKYV